MIVIDPIRLQHAAEMLNRYADFISEHVKAADLELHPYQPEVEEAAAYLASLSVPVDALSGWQPIETAPRTGEHILVSDFRVGELGFGFCGGIRQPWQDVVHWFDDPEMPGLYCSTFGGDQPRPVTHCTHWKRLDVRPIERIAGKPPR